MTNTYVNNHPFLIEDQNSGNLYYLKCISSIQSTRAATVTQYPTVSGKSISDNMYVEPKQLSVSLALGSLLLTPHRYSTSTNKTLEAITTEELKQLFKDWQADSIRLNITTFEDHFSNMVLSNIQSTEGETLGVWNVGLTFTEVRIAEVTEIKLEFPDTATDAADGDQEVSLGSDNGSVVGEVGSFIGEVGAGALAGAGIGSFFPGVGTAIGAAIGGAIGFFEWIYNRAT